MRQRLVLLVLVAAAMLGSIAACGGDDDDDQTPTVSPSPTATPVPTPRGTNAPGNLLTNPGFEFGGDPWSSLDPESSFVISQDAAFTGLNSAFLQMDVAAGTEGDRVFYVVQEITPAELPEKLSGAYRVQNWVKGTEKQYLQAVVIVYGADNSPVTDAENFQLRYILAGVDAPPLKIANAGYLFFSDKDPVVGPWLSFEAPIRDDFERVWGVIPEGFDKIRVLFEVRYDDRVATDGPSHADVWYDDLYLGSAQ